MKCKPIAICGTIGSGKTTVCRYLQQQGFPVADCDQIARDIANLPAVIAKIEALLGKNYLHNGKIDRRMIRELIFSDVALYKEYSEIFFGEVKTALEQQIADITGYVFVEIQVLTAFEFPWHAVWQVTTDRDTAVDRVVTRDSVDKFNVESILTMQNYTFAPNAVIVNNTNFDELYRKVDELVGELRGQGQFS
jgi:dephospho-CoA kinase